MELMDAEWFPLSELIADLPAFIPQYSADLCCLHPTPVLLQPIYSNLYAYWSHTARFDVDCCTNLNSYQIGYCLQFAWRVNSHSLCLTNAPRVLIGNYIFKLISMTRSRHLLYVYLYPSFMPAHTLIRQTKLNCCKVNAAISRHWFSLHSEQHKSLANRSTTAWPTSQNLH